MYQSGTDTLHIKVTDVRYQVTEDTIRAVFDPIAAVARVQILPSNDTSCAIAVVQFHDIVSAETARRERNGRCIYSDCNRMEIAFTHWNQIIPAQGVRNPQPHSILSTPPAGGFNQPMNFPQVPQQQHQMMHQHLHHHHQMSGMMQSAGMVHTPGMMQHQSGGRGFRGRGGYQGRGAAGNGMGMGLGGMGMLMNPAAMMGSLPAGMGLAFPGTTTPANIQSPYVSVAMLAEDIPLQHLFTVLECWGNVVYIKRNFQKPQVVTVKYQSYAEAVNCATHMKRLPIGDSECEISGRVFGHFQEKSGFIEPTDEGDPNDPSLKQFNFSSSKHRMSAARCKCPASETLKITGLSSVIASFSTSEEVLAAISNSFEMLGVPTSNVVEEGSGGVFLATFSTLRQSVKALILGHGKLCGEEKACLVFVPKPAATQLTNQPDSDAAQ